jgi:ribosomal protein S18 acetylase RimI-like enzyme
METTATIGEKVVTLKDHRDVLIREMRSDDFERSYEFFRELPPEDRMYLRNDVTRRDIVERRIRDMEYGRVRRLVAISGDEIVADGTLELAGHGWGENVAEIRLIVARPYQRLGLGRILTRELYLLAAEHRVDRIVGRVMRPQKRALAVFRRLGFHDEFVIPKHVRDQKGEWQDLVLMRCNLGDLWNEMENMYAHSDWQRAR